MNNIIHVFSIKNINRKNRKIKFFVILYKYDNKLIEKICYFD